MSPHRVIAALVLAAFVAGCRDHRAERIEIIRTPLVINTTLFTRVGASVVDATGRPSDRDIVLVSPDTALLEVRRGAVACHDDGEVVLELRAGPARRSVPVICHIARTFALPQTVSLAVGGPGKPLQIAAYDRSGQLIDGARLPITVEDTGVIEIRNGLVYGKRVGSAGITTESAGKFGGAIVWVDSVAVSHAVGKPH